MSIRPPPSATNAPKAGASVASTPTASTDQAEADSPTDPEQTPAYTLPDQPQVKNQIVGARIGCGLIFVAGVALVLFLLFVLPNMLYEDAAPVDESPENVEEQPSDTER